MALAPKLLSTQTRGESILIAGTATGNTLVHTWPTTTTTFQDIYLKISAVDAVAYDYTVEVGVSGTMTIVAYGTVPVKAGSITEKIRIQGNATATLVNVFASTTNKLRVSGEVNEYTA